MRPSLLLLSVLLSATPPSLSEVTTVGSGVATRAAPTAATEGMTLGGVRGFRVSVCAAASQTLSGTGTVDIYLYNPRASLWQFNVSLQRTITVTSTSCAGAACRCQVFDDFDAGPVSANGYRIVAAPNAVAVSGGANVTVYIDSCLGSVPGQGGPC